MRFLVTGTAGFIGFHLARRLLADGHEVAGLDAMTDYYDVALKEARHARLRDLPGFSEHIQRLEDLPALEALADAFKPQVIVHLAAQAGVRYSIDHPRSYVDANLIGVFNVLEAARRHGVEHLLMASTSSVYGGNRVMPFREADAADHPLSFYAATKKAGEAMSHSYSHLWNIPTTAFRFFTVYGPWGRPDMVPFKFVAPILAGEPIPIFNNGDMERDFTYIDDLVEGIVGLVGRPPVKGQPLEDAADSLSAVAPWRVVNIGRGAPVRLMDFIEALEGSLGRKAERNFLPMQPGDTQATFADNSLLKALTGYQPATEVGEGVAAFCAWYRDFYGV